MALSSRSFVRTVGLGGVSSAFIVARGREELLAAGLSDAEIQASRRADPRRRSRSAATRTRAGRARRRWRPFAAGPPTQLAATRTTSMR